MIYMEIGHPDFMLEIERKIRERYQLQVLAKERGEKDNENHESESGA